MDIVVEHSMNHMDKKYSFHCSPVPTQNEAGTEADNHNQIENYFHMNHTSKSRMWGVEGDINDSDSEGDNLFLERLFHDDPIPLPDTLDFSNVVRGFLPFFAYPVTSLILLSSGSEDTIFDPSIYHFSSLELGVSHRSGTFMKFNIYPNHLNESSMEILSSTCSPMDQ
nr:hypothetical protein [Tanacetum cinerariifolium]